MGCYITFDDLDLRYNDIKSLSFAPEIDTTCATLPICEFSADIVHDDAPPNGWLGQFITLWEDQGRETATNKCLAAKYEIVEAEEQSDNVVHIRAQSLVGYLERRILPPLYIPGYPGMSAVEFISKLFTDTPVNDVEMSFDPESLPFEISPEAFTSGYWKEYSDYLDQNNPISGFDGGFCPQQTARERLQWFCQAYELKVVQFGVHSESGLYIDRLRVEPYKTYATYIEIDRTYWKPKVKRVSNYERVDITYYSNYTYDEHQGNDWEKYVIQEGWSDPESGQSQEEIAIYYKRNISHHQMTPNANDNTVYMTGNTLLQNRAAAGYDYHAYCFGGNNLKFEYWRHYEVELDILQVKKDGTEDYLWPGDKVMFHTAPDTICYGLIKSCELTFGNLVRAKLRISTDLKPVDVVHTDKLYFVDLWYKRGSTFYHRNATFAKKRYTLPHNYYKRGTSTTANPFVVKLYPIYVDSGNGIAVFEPVNETDNIYSDYDAGSVQTWYVAYRYST